MTGPLPDYSNIAAATARYLATPGKGILFVNSTSCDAFCASKFADSGFLQYINGTCFTEEALKLTSTNKEKPPCVEICEAHGVLPGFMVDVESGIAEFAWQVGSSYLLQRGRGYYEAGARFVVLHVKLRIGPDDPSENAITIIEKTPKLAKYAAIYQKSGLVPIVFPEILREGSHDIEKCAKMTKHVLAACCKAFTDHDVQPEGTVFMINMVTPGFDAPKVGPEVVALHTVKALKSTVPAAVPAVFFPSNYSEEVLLSLSAINQFEGKQQWNLSFSLDVDCKAWVKKKEALMTMAEDNSKAALGTYKGDTQAVGDGAYHFWRSFRLGTVLVGSLMLLTYIKNYYYY